METDCGDVFAVDGDGAAGEFDETEKRGHDGGFASAGAAYDADAFAAGDKEVEVLEDEREAFAVAHLDIFEFDGAGFGPGFGDLG